MTPEQILLLVLGVLLGFPALLLLILSVIRARVHVQLQDGVSVSLHILGFHIPLWRDQKATKKRKRLKRCRDPHWVLAKEVRNTKRALLKKRRKAENKQKKKAEKKQKKAKRPKLNLDEKFELLRKLIAICYVKTHGRIRIHVKALHIWVGASDAAKTAILYGATAQCLACALELIHTTYYADITYDKNAVSVAPDFRFGTTGAQVDLVCSISFLRGLMIYRSVTKEYNCAKYDVYKKAIQRRKEELLAKQAARTAKK